MANMMTIKLDNLNYIVWKHQISMVLETYSMIELLDEVQLVPKKFLKDLSDAVTTVLNPTIGCSSALEVWRVLENRFSSISRSHVMNLKGELHNIRKGSDSICRKSRSLGTS